MAYCANCGKEHDIKYSEFQLRCECGYWKCYHCNSEGNDGKDN